MSLSRENRIVLIRHIENSYADISIQPLNEKSLPIIRSGAPLYYVTQRPGIDSRNDIYLFPFIFKEDGSPWQEANLFLFSSIMEGRKGFTDSDSVRKKAKMLLEFKLYCEDNSIDMFDFSGRKPQRPTYRYFFHLLDEYKRGVLQRSALNKKTKIVYDFYKHLSMQYRSELDIERVDTVTSVTLFLKNSHGHTYSVQKEKRCQTVPECRQAKPTPIGFVREYGEDLRPLHEGELAKLIDVLESDVFAVDERLMHYIALHTGARKQSILTMRMKHLKAFTADNILSDNTYRIHAGPGTGIDTKFNKKQTLYFPRELAENIVVYARSKKASDRRNKFTLKHGKLIDDDDMYVFLSPEGEPHYMAKDDPRYKTTKSRQQGRNTYYMKNKLLKYADMGFPRDFTFHWLRSTFALHYYRLLQPLVAKGCATDGDIISLVQKRLHHADRKTTEHYLKLFDCVSDRLTAQQIYEERALNLYPE